MKSKTVLKILDIPRVTFYNNEEYVYKKVVSESFIIKLLANRGVATTPFRVSI